jgi:cytochrome c-type protein NapB
MKSIVVMALLLLLSGESFSEEMIATMREGVPLTTQNANPHKLKSPMNADKRRPRAYPMQPPTIPHQIENYQVDRKANKCLSCHARTRVSESNAPMVSVTHYMDRDGNFLADVSPRRYFCTQCHVPQHDVKPIVENTFVDMHTLNTNEKSAQSHQ